MSSINIFGNGYVGGAYADYLEENGYDIVRIDPKFEDMQPTVDTSNPSIICVPAPTGDDGIVNHSIITTILKGLPKDIPILIKSTVNPEYIRRLNILRPNVTYSPEFLTAANAASDIRTNEIVILGGKPTSALWFWEDLFENLGKHVHVTDARTASFMKYAVNTFLATKVVFMNELHDQYDGNWGKLKALLELDPRLGTSHMDVPGADGRGYGGACFPKDVKAFLKFTSDEYMQGMSVLHKAQLVNEKWRK